MICTKPSFPDALLENQHFPSQAEQVLEVEAKSGFGEKITPVRNESTTKIKLVFDLELDNRDRDGPAMYTLGKGTNVLHNRGVVVPESPSRDRGEQLQRFLNFGSKMKYSKKTTMDNRFPSSKEKIDKKGDENRKHRMSLKPRGKFSAILEKWKKYNNQPLYKKPLSLNLKQYEVQFDPENLILPQDFLKGNPFKKVAGFPKEIGSGEGKAASGQSLSRTRNQPMVKREDGTLLFRRNPNNYPETKKYKTNSAYKKIKGSREHSSESPASEQCRGNASKCKAKSLVQRLVTQGVLLQKIKSPEASTKEKVQIQRQPAQRTTAEEAQATLSASNSPPTNPTTNPSFPVSAEEIARYLLDNCPITRLSHVRRICQAFGINFKQSSREEEAASEGQHRSQIEEVVEVKQFLSKRRKRGKRKQRERHSSSWTSTIYKIIKALFRSMRRFTR